MLERIDEVMAIMLPSLREERAASYSPFLPICPRTGMVLYVPIVAHDVKAGTVSYDDPETRERVTRSRSPAATASCNGSRTGRCAGSRSASTMKWPART